MSANAGLPELKIGGTGEVAPPLIPATADYAKHYHEFRSRGLSHEDADRHARAVVARDTHPTKE
jgi:hypothetical protein